MPKMATSDENAAQRNVIEYCVQLKMTPTQTLHQLQATDKYKSVSRSLVFKWHKRFVDGWTEEQRGNAGRPREFDDRLIQSVTHAIKEDRRLTIREVALISGCSKSTVHRILHENLNMSRVRGVIQKFVDFLCCVKYI
jgi:transposase